MKTLLLYLLIAAFTISVNAQTKNSLIFKNASVKYKNLEKTGTVLTVIGGVALFTGNIMYWKIYNDNGNQEPRQDKAATYRGIMLGGLGVMAVGIPLWATGKAKLRHIEIEARLVKFKGLASANGIGLKIRF